MPVITDIKRQKRDDSRYSIYIDGGYAFALTDLELSNSGLRSGQDLTTNDVELWRKRSLEAKAYNQALGYIQYRRRSQREVEIYLARKEYEPDTISSIIERLVNYAFINDRTFAEAWIADRRALKPRSRRMLMQELSAKGVTREIIDEVLGDTEDDEVETLVLLIEQKRRLSRYANQEKLIGYLARQGYGYGKIKEALARLSDN